MLKITLKDGNELYVNGFKEVFFPYDETTCSDISEFTLKDAVTYVFKGENVISILGSQILYLEFTESN